MYFSLIKEGQGFYNIMDFFNRSRVHVAALGVGTAQGAPDKAVSHVRKRQQFGKALAHFHPLLAKHQSAGNI